MIHVLDRRTREPAQQEQELLGTLARIAQHQSYLGAKRAAGQVEGVGVRVIAAAIEDEVRQAGMAIRIDDRGDRWVEKDGAAVLWLGNEWPDQAAQRLGRDFPTDVLIG